MFFQSRRLSSMFTLPNLIEKNGQPIPIAASLYDLNGISTANLHLQRGGSFDELIFPLTKVIDNEYRAIIPDSLIDVYNFRAKVIG